MTINVNAPELADCKCGSRPNMTTTQTYSYLENRMISTSFNVHCSRSGCLIRNENPHYVKKGAAIRAWNKLCET